MSGTVGLDTLVVKRPPARVPLIASLVMSPVQSSPSSRRALVSASATRTASWTCRLPFGTTTSTSYVVKRDPSP